MGWALVVRRPPLGWGQAELEGPVGVMGWKVHSPGWGGVPERAGGWREPGEGTLSLSLAEHLLCPGPGPGLSQESAPPTLRVPCEVGGQGLMYTAGNWGAPCLPCVALMASPRTCTRDPPKRKQSRAGEGRRLGTFRFLF